MRLSRSAVIFFLFAFIYDGVRSELMVEGKIIEIRDPSHILVEDAGGTIYLLGHIFSFNDDNLGQNYRFYALPRKLGRYIVKSSQSFLPLAASHKGYTCSQLKESHTSYHATMRKGDDVFSLTLPKSEIRSDPHIVGNKYDLATLESDYVRDLRPAFKEKVPEGYARWVLLDANDGGMHGIFSKGEEVRHMSLRNFPRSFVDLGRPFDLEHYTKLFMSHAEPLNVEKQSLPQIAGRIVGPTKTHHFILEREPHQKMVISPSPSFVWSGHLTGKKVSVYGFPLYHNVKISEEADLSLKDEKEVDGMEKAVLLNLISPAKKQGALLATFLTSQGYKIVLFPHTATLTPSLLGKTLLLENRPMFYVHDMQAASQKDPPPGYSRYMLDTVDGNHHYITLSEGEKKISADLGKMVISPSQIGEKFDFQLYPMMQASEVEVEESV